MIRCLYDCGSGSDSTQKYHVYPFSASKLDVQLEKGVVCDGCNAYFSKLERYFIERHPGASMRLLHVARTRKGKPPTFAHQDGVATRENNSQTFSLTLPLQSIRHETLENGDIKFIGNYRPFPFDSLKIGRLLAKITLEFLYSVGGPKYDPFLSRFDELRHYARRGPGKLKYVWFSWKHIDETQRPPQLVMIRTDSGELVSVLCRISLPGVAYLLPLPPFINPDVISENLVGWQVVGDAGETMLGSETVETLFIRADNRPK